MKKIIVLVLVASISACASSPQISMQSETKNNIKSIAIIQTKEPDRYMMYPKHMSGGFMLYAFGALGGAILGGIEGGKVDSASKSFTEALTPYHPSVSNTFQTAIADQLKAKGYQVEIVPEPPEYYC